MPKIPYQVFMVYYKTTPPKFYGILKQFCMYLV